MAERIEDGVRIRFERRYLGQVQTPPDAALRALAHAVEVMDAAGCCPVLEDGKSAGNGAVLASGRLFVTPSGRVPGSIDPADLVELVRFEPGDWIAEFRSRDPSLAPTSDAPLYWAALIEAAADLPEPLRPAAALHGHVMDTERAAEALGLPISRAETLFSTPPDREALLQLLRGHPYPTDHAWIRRGHGFFVLGDDMEQARMRTLTLAERARALGVL